MVMMAVIGSTLGCGSPVSPVAATVAVGPHQGTMIRLADDLGFVEFVNEPEVSDRRNPQPTSIVAYFFQSDGKAALSPAPSDVSFSLDTGLGESGRGGSKGVAQVIPLAADPKANEPGGSSRFASKPGPYGLASIRGKLSAKISGRELSTPFAGRR
jgi:hypothetical protein